MLILPDWNKPYIIDNTSDPLIVTHHWVLSGTILDYMLTPFYYLEETTGKVVSIMIEGFEFDIPASWNILITDGDTYSIDTVPINKLAGNPFKAVMFTPTDNKVRTADIFITDLKENVTVIHPLIQKGHMLCHPVGPKVENRKTIELACMIGPHDLQRYLTNLVVGDLL